MSRRRSSWLVAVVVVLLAALGVVGASAAPPPRCNGPQRGHRLEPNRDKHARPDSGPCGRSATCTPDQHGDDPRRRLRRDECDHAEAPSAVSPQEAFLGEGVARRRCRDRCVPRSLQHRLHGAAEHPVPEQGSLLQSLATQYATSLAAIPDKSFKRQGIAAGPPPPT